MFWYGSASYWGYPMVPFWDTREFRPEFSCCKHWIWSLLSPWPTATFIFGRPRDSLNPKFCSPACWMHWHCVCWCGYTFTRQPIKTKKSDLHRYSCRHRRRMYPPMPPPTKQWKGRMAPSFKTTMQTNKWMLLMVFLVHKVNLPCTERTGMSYWLTFSSTKSIEQDWFTCEKKRSNALSLLCWNTLDRLR